MMPIAVLAGGLATRMRPLTEHVPKLLLTVAGKPFIDHLLALFYRQGLRDIVLCVSYLGEQIQDHVGDGSDYGLRIQYSFDASNKNKRLGTGGAIKSALPLLGKNFFVAYGDSYLMCDYAAIQEAYSQQKKPALMTVFKNDNAWDSSNVSMQGDAISAYDKVNKTTKMNYIDYGLGVFNQQCFDDVKKEEPSDLEKLYQDLLTKSALASYIVTQRFYEMGSMSGLAELETLLA